MTSTETSLNIEQTVDQSFDAFKEFQIFTIDFLSTKEKQIGVVLTLVLLKCCTEMINNLFEESKNHVLLNNVSENFAKELKEFLERNLTYVAMKC